MNIAEESVQSKARIPSLPEGFQISSVGKGELVTKFFYPQKDSSSP
jgi:hypothetical protein